MSSDVDAGPEVVASAGRQRRVLLVLCCGQVLGGIAVGTGLSVTALVAAAISGADSMGGLAQTSVVVGAGLLALPVSRLAARHGRRPALVVGYGVAALGALVAAVGVATEQILVLLPALLAFGGGSTAGLAARYAATDLAVPDRRARDLSIVVWATTIGSVAGPNLADPAQQVARALGVAGFAGPYLLAVAGFGLATLVVAVALRPDPLRVGAPAAVAAVAEVAKKRSGTAARAAAWRALRSSPRARLALTGIVLGHTVMVGLMVMTPVHMDHGGATLRIVGVVISLHIAGMYALSPVVGWLADRFGREPVLGLGAILLVGAAALTATAPPTGAGQLAVGLVLLGLGWSCGLVAGSALLTDSVPASVRPDAQGLSDLSMNAGGALGGVLAGATVALWSYATLAVAVGVLVLPFLVVVATGPWRVRPSG